MKKSYLMKAILSLLITTGFLSGLSTAIAQGTSPQSNGNNGTFDGQWVYETHCSSCHGKNGEGFYPFGIALRGNAMVQNSPPQVIINVIQNGRDDNVGYTEYSGMPPFDYLRGAEVRAVVGYIKGQLQQGH